MPNPGDICTGDKIGRRAEGRFQYVLCPVCKTCRWVSYTGAQFVEKTSKRRCNACRLKSTKMWVDNGDASLRRY